MKIPKIFYGTAWKEDKTSDLTFTALQAGFRAIDTANQRKHYFEEGVGEGIARFLSESDVTREDLFLQTKFTYQRGQDSRLPYNPESKLRDQVKQSVESSFEHLKTDYLDSLILHGPFLNEGLSDEDWEVWESMEQLLKQDKVKSIGVSNFQLAQLAELSDRVSVKPKFIQNRCFANTGWDQDVRQLCQSNGILYQGFSLLTANPAELQSSTVKKIATRHKVTSEQIILRFSQQIGMIPLTGTTSLEHMKLDLSIGDFELNPEEVELIENISLN